MEGTVTVAENSDTNNNDKKALTIDGTRYKASAQIGGQNLSDVSVKQDYTIYVDAYGYMIYVEEVEEIGNYALILNIKGGTDWYLATALSCCSPTAPPRSSPPTRTTTPRRTWFPLRSSPTR
ncbi:MAG: hypothetical protein ACLUS6_05345 [Dysosmobacter sp.]